MQPSYLSSRYDERCVRVCSQSCLIACGKCFVVLSYVGEKHSCPDRDEGFYGGGSKLLCDFCEEIDEQGTPIEL